MKIVALIQTAIKTLEEDHRRQDITAPETSKIRSLLHKFCGLISKRKSNRTSYSLRDFRESSRIRHQKSKFGKMNTKIVNSEWRFRNFPKSLLTTQLQTNLWIISSWDRTTHL